MRPRFQWNLGRRSLTLGERTLVMGVLNVTPDSFSDGGRYFDLPAAIAHGLELLDEGADILDIGGESTRPGTPIDSPVADVRAGAVSAQQELDRVLPVLEGIRRERPSAILSIDTYKSVVARAALEAGAEIVNDVSGLAWDAAMAATLATLPCGVVLMHTRGIPAEWAALPPLPDPVPLVLSELRARADAALGAGIARSSIVLDPGFGFGKRGDENYALLARLAELHALGFPLLAGLSRKSFLARTREARLAHLNAFPPGAPAAAAHRDASIHDTVTLAALVSAALAGAHIVRVHAVALAVEALAIADAILQAQS
jgi:dihydropteroate synthase